QHHAAHGVLPRRDDGGGRGERGVELRADSAVRDRGRGVGQRRRLCGAGSARVPLLTTVLSHPVRVGSHRARRRGGADRVCGSRAVAGHAADHRRAAARLRRDRRVCGAARVDGVLHGRRTAPASGAPPAETAGRGVRRLAGSDGPAGGQAVTRARVAAAVLAVTALAVALRLIGLRYGLPAVYNPDEVAIVSRALAFAKGDPNPHNFLYPTFYFYVLFAW